MRIIGCDVHARQQTIAMLNRETGEVLEQTLKHEADFAPGSARGRPPVGIAGVTGSLDAAHRGPG
jgi:hypothetical protein